MSQQAKRLRRIGPSRATVRHDLNARDVATESRRYGAGVVRFAR